MEQILTARQQRALAIVMREPGLREFYLSGGTALAAFDLQHRYSDDLDFFCESDVDDLFLTAFVPRLVAELQATSVRREKLHDRRLFFLGFTDDELKIEFTHYPFLPCEPRRDVNGVRVDSLRDLAANKLAALLDRFDPKDFVDLYFLLHGRQLQEIKMDTEKKFGFTISPLRLGSELMKVQRIVALPRMVKPLDPSALRDFFMNQARLLRDEVIE